MKPPKISPTFSRSQISEHHVSISHHGRPGCQICQPISPRFPAIPKTSSTSRRETPSAQLPYETVYEDKFDITHYLFTPTRKNTSLINFFSRPTHGKTIQTIATLREDLYGPKQWKQLLFADRIVVYSDYSKALLENIGMNHVSRIYPGVDLSFYQPAQKNPETLRAFDLTPEDFVVTYNGEYARLGATDMLARLAHRILHGSSGFQYEICLRLPRQKARG
jgi:glycosyltransferase involved in cell wall biosynthesis